MNVKFRVKFYGLNLDLEDDGCLYFEEDVFLFSMVIKKRVKNSFQFDKALFDVHSKALAYAQNFENVRSYSVEVVND